MTDRELMQQALEAMMTIRPYEVVDYDPLEASIAALRERLAQPEQPSVPWSAALESVWGEPEQGPVAWADMDVRGEDKGLSWTPGHFHKTPLYTTPPQRKPWVGLTDEERNSLWRDVVGWGDPSHDDEDLMKAIEAKLKEKNT